jgi:hypothetical protein
MYTRGEMALRLGLFYTAASLSGAFGGMFLSLILDVQGTDSISKVSLLEDLLTLESMESSKSGAGYSSLKDYS